MCESVEFHLIGLYFDVHSNNFLYLTHGNPTCELLLLWWEYGDDDIIIATLSTAWDDVGDDDFPSLSMEAPMAAMLLFLRDSVPTVQIRVGSGVF